MLAIIFVTSVTPIPVKTKHGADGNMMMAGVMKINVVNNYQNKVVQFFH